MTKDAMKHALLDRVKASTDPAIKHIAMEQLAIACLDYMGKHDLVGLAFLEYDIDWDGEE